MGKCQALQTRLERLSGNKFDRLARLDLNLFAGFGIHSGASLAGSHFEGGKPDR
jgi:hypothetical protein